MNGDDSEKKVPHGREQLWDAGWKSWDSPLTKTWSQTLGTGVHIWGGSDEDLHVLPFCGHFPREVCLGSSLLHGK